MMKLSKTKISGEITAVPSKSIAQRLYCLSLLSNDTTEIFNPSFSNDSLTMKTIITKLGCQIIENPKFETIYPAKISEDAQINCNESALCARILSPILSIFPYKFEIIGNGTLINRPMNDLEQLQQLNAKIKTNSGKLPIQIEGPISSGEIYLDLSLSSQFLSGLLIALPKLENPSKITVNNFVSRPYIDLTMDLTKQFGGNIKLIDENVFEIYPSQYKGGKFKIEGDWSSAIFFLIAGAIAGDCSVYGLNQNSLQSDKVIIEILKQVGSNIILTNEFISIQKNNLNSFEFDAKDAPDLVPLLSVLAANCKGESKIYNVERLVFKESDRLNTMILNLRNFGVKANYENQTLKIVGSKIQGGTFITNNDHRLAMAGALLSLTAENDTIIDSPTCVAKSYPSFWLDFQKVIL